MKRNQTLLLLFTCMSLSVFSQVGINTTTPKPGSLLDVESTDKGIFIPKVDIANLSTIAPITGVVTPANAEGLLVYNTNGTTGEGYYYWSGTQWVALAPVEDGDFHQEGTSSAPTAITQDVFRTGNVAIGKPTADYPLDIDDLSTTRALNVNTTAATTGVIYGIYVNNQNTAATTSARYGMFTRVRVPAGQSNQAYGTYNELTGGGGTGNQVGTFNRMIGNEDRNITGVNNYFTGTGNGQHIGVNNNVANTGTGIHTGVQNSMRGSTGEVRAVYNVFNNNAGSGINRGMSTAFNNSGSGLQQGVYTSVIGTGSGEHVGVASFLNSSGNGDLSGTITTFGGNATGTGIHRGTYNNVSGGGALYGIENDVDGTQAGQTAYGTFNDVNSNNGTNIAGWFDAHGTGATYFAAVFNRGDVVANETGGDFDFRIEGQTDNDLFFADASADNVGIGTNTPGYKLDVAGDINTTGDLRNSGVINTPDYVFETYFDGISKFDKSYKMISLKDLEKFIKKNKHLPNIQSRADVLKNGWNVTEGVRDNLEKIEELFLHTIEASKKIETLQTENSTLKNQLNQAIDAIEALQKRLSKLEKQN